MSDGVAAPPDPPADGLVGSVLAGRYRIVRRLGDGAMGAVYLGEHLKFGRLDAIKVLRDGMARDKEATERFLRGARNASAINHPNVCTVYDFSDTDDGLQFLAMEFVDGVTLGDVVETEGRLSPERAIEIVRQIGEALDAAHHLGIVHRDLKPGNVMLARGRTGEDVVKVVDFDIAKGTAEGAGSEVTRTGFVVGTPEYMSPEQLIGDPLDGRSDVYSLALVFVRILTGRLPVRAGSTQDLMVERLTQEPLTLAELDPDLAVPPAVQAALDHGLQRRREDRPATAGAFAGALVRALHGEAPTSAVGPTAEVGKRGRLPGGRPAAGGPAAGNGPGVPATTVGAAPSSGTGAPSLATAPASRRRLLPWLVGGGAALAAVAVIAVLLPDAATTPESPASTPPISESATDSGPVTAPVTDPGTGSDPGSDPGSDVAVDDPPRPPDSTPPPVRTDPDPIPPDPTPTRTVPTLSVAAAEDLLFRQLGALSDVPGAATRQAARDSATQVWEQTTLPDSARAFAAFIMASAFDAAGREADALPWARRAVDLDPTNRGFRRLLQKLGGGRP